MKNKRDVDKEIKEAEKVIQRAIRMEDIALRISRFIRCWALTFLFLQFLVVPLFFILGGFSRLTFILSSIPVIMGVISILILMGINYWLEEIQRRKENGSKLD